MDKYTEQWIAKMAEEKYPGYEIGFRVYQLKRIGYSAGLEDMKEHLGGFAEWLVQRKVQPIGKNFWEDWEQNDDESQTVPVLTTDQLIELYFEQLNAKK